MMEISSSFIRQAISEGRDIRHFLPSRVWKYMRDMHFYEK
jgi:nicotinate-nucleotide adenylyltransferase